MAGELGAVAKLLSPVEKTRKVIELEVKYTTPTSIRTSGRSRFFV